jgi:hypothetical protein
MGRRKKRIVRMERVLRVLYNMRSGIIDRYSWRMEIYEKCENLMEKEERKKTGNVCITYHCCSFA